MGLISYDVMTFHLPNHGGNNTDYEAQGCLDHRRIPQWIKVGQAKCRYIWYLNSLFHCA